MSIDTDLFSPPCAPDKDSTSDLELYKLQWTESCQDPHAFFGRMAKSLLDWHQPFSRVRNSLDNFRGQTAWFDDGKINACYNCVDRHAFLFPDRPALVFEPEGPFPSLVISYSDLLFRVSAFANALLSLGVQPGHVVAIYLPMIPETAIAMLACARIGAVHSVVFSGFSFSALRDRLYDAKCRVLVTADCYSRAGKHHDLLSSARSAVIGRNSVQHIIVIKNKYVYTTPSADSIAAAVVGCDNSRAFDSPVHIRENTVIHDFDQLLSKSRAFCDPIAMNSEDPLFVLYTSGSTGTPKGLVHSTAGYLCGAAMTTINSFALNSTRVIASTADFGWITGHTYGLYGPLLIGATTLIIAAPPTFLGTTDIWTILARNKVNAFYTAPTVLRVLRSNNNFEAFKLNESTIRKHLMVLGSVGEAIDPDTWRWFHSFIGGGVTPVVDTYWQTETGSHVLAPLPFCTPTSPGSATLPVYGLDPVLVDPVSLEIIQENTETSTGILCFRGSWPSMARTILHDHERYISTYFPLEKHKDLFWTGDSATRLNSNGYIYVRGRVDDVLNVAAHRLSTAEIESALLSLGKVIQEAAVVGKTDKATGHRIVAFVTLSDCSVPESEVKKLVQVRVRDAIGPIAVPKDILIIRALPKTRSGKIMRRILRKIANGDHDFGDLSTLEDAETVSDIVKASNKIFAV